MLSRCLAARRPFVHVFPGGIPEPLPHCPGIASAVVDWVLVPGVAFDAAGRRLGYGGGYYDRSLALVGPRTRLLALADTENVLEHIPAEAHDRPVHGVITPDGVLDFGTWHSPE